MLRLRILEDELLKLKRAHNSSPQDLEDPFAHLMRKSADEVLAYERELVLAMSTDLTHKEAEVKGIRAMLERQTEEMEKVQGTML